jgi:hypothetical protein
VLGVSGRIFGVVELQAERAGAHVGDGEEKIRSAEEILGGRVDAGPVARNNAPGRPFDGRGQPAVTIEMSDPGRRIRRYFDRRFDSHAVNGTRTR